MAITTQTTHERILTAPRISECSTVPLEETRRSRLSTTSRNISFLRCLMPGGRHDTALVTADGGASCVSARLADSVMYSFRILLSVLCGYLSVLLLLSSSSSPYVVVSSLL
jgi:hypothetical protein